MRVLGVLVALLLACCAANATIALDGSTTNQGHGTSSCTIVTPNGAGTNDIIVVTAGADNTNATGSAPAITGYSDTGSLTWHSITPLAGVNYHSAINGNAFATIGMAWAFKSGASSATTITVTFSGTIDNCGLTAWLFNGANTATPMDTNVGIPFNNGGVNTSGAPSVASVSTSCATDMLIQTAGWWGSGGDPPSQTTGTGFTVVQYTAADNGSNFGAVATQIGVFASTQTSQTFSFGTSWVGNLSVIAAVQDAAASCSGGSLPLPAGSFMMNGIGE